MKVELNMRLAALICSAFAAAGCGPTAPTAVGEKSWRLFDSPWAKAWMQAGIPDEGAVLVQGGELALATGQTLTGARFGAWAAPEFPLTNYAVTYEAMREEGRDFFGTVTFPVGSHDGHASFVLGGWGGTVTGISSIDFSDANENQTRGEMAFENGRWYRVKVEVRPTDLRAWVDERPMVNVSIKGRQVRLRPGFIDHCRPFGFASYGTAARIRNLVVERLQESTQ